MKKFDWKVAVFLTVSFMFFGVLTVSASNMGGRSIVPDEKKQVTLSFAGDCTIGTDLSYGRSGSFVEMVSVQNQNWGYFFSNVKEIFDQDDLTIVNLESPLTNSGGKRSKQFAFKGAPEFANILKAGGVEVANLANNHTYDYGNQGYLDTQKALDAVGVSYFGEEIIDLQEVNGVKVGFLGFNGWNNDAGIKTRIKNGIENLRNQGADIVAITFHWGKERANYPNAIQKDLARYSIDQGVDIVVGHHPHVLQGIEIYKEKPIVYSLANFCFGGNRNPSDKDTMIYQQTFEINSDGTAEIGETKIIPCSVSSVTHRNDYKPTPLSGAAAKRIYNRLISYSSSMNTADFITNSFQF